MLSLWPWLWPQTIKIIKCLALTSETKAKGLTCEANGLTSEADAKNLTTEARVKGLTFVAKALFVNLRPLYVRYALQECSGSRFVVLFMVQWFLSSIDKCK